MDDKTIIVRVSPKLHRAFKVKCAQDGTNMNKVLTDLIENYVKDKQIKRHASSIR